MTEQERGTSASAQGMHEAIANDDALLREAAEVEQLLRVIRHEMLRVIRDDQSRGQLTPPQVQAMVALFHANQAGASGGLTLKELSERMGLAHSTVSGIIDRLERRGMVYRQVDPADRRSTRIVMTERVRAYIEQQLMPHLRDPLLAALRRATSEEREAILTGLSTLHRLLTQAQGERNTH